MLTTKLGLPSFWILAINLAKPDNKIPHGLIEITFTRDEEMGMFGVQNLDTSKLNSKYAVICDGEIFRRIGLRRRQALQMFTLKSTVEKAVILALTSTTNLNQRNKSSLRA